VPAARVLDPVPERDDAQQAEDGRLPDAGLEPVEEVEEEAREGEGRRGDERDLRAAGPERAQRAQRGGFQVLDRLRAELPEDPGVVDREREDGRPGVRPEDREEQEGPDVLGDRAQEDEERARGPGERPPRAAPPPLPRRGPGIEVQRVALRPGRGREGIGGRDVPGRERREGDRSDPGQRDREDRDRERLERAREPAAREQPARPVEGVGDAERLPAEGRTASPRRAGTAPDSRSGAR
jgi:hypothetical protein